MGASGAELVAPAAMETAAAANPTNNEQYARPGSPRHGPRGHLVRTAPGFRAQCRNYPQVKLI